MKGFKNIVLIIVASMVLVCSCNNDEYEYTYMGDNYVQFKGSEGTFFVLEDTSVHFSIDAQIIGDAPSSKITMPVEFIDSAIIDGNWVSATILYSQIGISSEPSLTIGAGQYTGALTVSGIYNMLDFGAVDTLLIQLNNGSVKSDVYNNIYLLKVQKYYPYMPEEYPGLYTGDYTCQAYPTWDAWGTTTTNPGLTIELGEEENTLVISEGFFQEQLDVWGEYWTEGPNPIVLNMNTDDPSNFVVEIAEVIKLGTSYYSDDYGPYDYWIGPHSSSGQFNAATKELSIKFNLYYEWPSTVLDEGEYNVILSDEQAEKLLGK